MSARSGGSGAPMTLSQVAGSPSFRSSAVNSIALIPLLSSDQSGHDNPKTHSSKSFQELVDALQRYRGQNPNSADCPPETAGDDVLVVVPNSNLTRPGDWKYDDTPLKNFHWGHGCQRMKFFDGRPYNSRMAHDRLINHELTRNWIDLCPHRRTAALIGVLNVRDCPDEQTLMKAKQEWEQWAERYSTPPYEVTAHGRDFERDFVVQRLFVFDSFHESNAVDVSKIFKGPSLVAFPPSENEGMIDNHMNVVINDLAVSVFRELEARIQESDSLTKGNDGQPLISQAARSRFFARSGKQDGEEIPQGSDNLSISNLASVVSPNSKLAGRENSKNAQPSKRASVQAKLRNVVVKGSSTQAQLLTPLDDVWEYTELNPKDAQEMLRREVGRREKFAADLALMAGSPMDAYERYMKAAELCRSTCPDPLWYAFALEGCAAAHIAMAEAGGFNVDNYLENSFQLPESIMSCAVVPSTEKSNKQDMSSVIAALCDDALNVLSRHPKLACFRAELLLKLAWYGAEIEDTHIRCQWGLGEGCHGGNVGADKRRWEMSSSTQFNFFELKNKHGEDVIAKSTLSRSKRLTECLHQAVSAGALDAVTRADVALRAASICLKGLRGTSRPPALRKASRVELNRKASFFAVVAAESMSEVEGSDEKASALWTHASRLLQQKGNSSFSGNYGWATLRAVALHGLAMQGLRETSEDAAVQLLSLMGEISPPKRKEDTGLFFSKFEDENDSVGGLDSSLRNDAMDNTSYIATGESVVSAARTYVRETRAKVAQAQKTNFLSGVPRDAALLTVAQSKWVEDDVLPTILLPMADFSQISESVIATRSVWSAIRFESCFTAQKRVVREISSLRMKIPASSLSRNSATFNASSLPIQVTSVVVVASESHAKLERVKSKAPEEKTGAMATFFNPYANKKGQEEIFMVPEEEERYILVRFANELSIPLEIPRCQLLFDVGQAGCIKAPAISFVIPGQTNNFAVQFPFLVLRGSDNSDTGTSRQFSIKGLQMTCLERSFFVSLIDSSGEVKEKAASEPNIPAPASQYPRRNYKDPKSKTLEGMKSPQLEIVPSQPNLHVSFANSPAPLEEDIVIPAPLADGEVFPLPKLVVANDCGIGGFGKIEELKITATGIPGQSEIVLAEFSELTEKSKDESAEDKKSGPVPLELIAHCEGVDRETLNASKEVQASSIALRLTAANDMGAHIKGCTITILFRYRGKAPSSSLQVWRKRKVELRVLRIKGPRVSSLTFRPDLNWDSAYTELCHSLAKQDQHKRYRKSKNVDGNDFMQERKEADGSFALSRLGRDPGVQVCGGEVITFLSVANETGSPIVLTRPGGTVGGFAGNNLETMKVMSGVSAKIPMILPRIERGTDVCEKLLSMTKLEWRSDIETSSPGELIETGGTMVPVNRRMRSGTLQMPLSCLKAIIDENPTFLPRICQAPCSIAVRVEGSADDKVVQVTPAKPVSVAVEMELAGWIPPDVLKTTIVGLQFCCARKGDKLDASKARNRDYVWSGQVRKTLDANDLGAKQGHRSRLVFLTEGHYVVSACISFKRSDIKDDVKEIWWAAKAQGVHVTKSSKTK